MPTIISGQVPSYHNTAANAIQQAQRIVEMHDEIMLYDPSAAPLSLLASAVSRKAVGNPKFDVLEDELIPHNDTVDYATGYATDATEIVFDNGTYFPVGSLVRNQRTGEVCKVSATSGTTVTFGGGNGIGRGWGGTTQTAINDGDYFTNLGVAAVEGATAGTSLMTQVSTGFNYTQIFRWPFEMSRTAMKSNLYGGDLHAYQQKKAAIEFKKRLDLAFFFGERSTDEAGTNVGGHRSTGGLYEFISTNVKDLGGSFNYVSFADLAKDLFRHGSKDKTAFISRALASNIALEAMGLIEKVESDKSLGMEINKLITPHGRLRLIVHDLLEGNEYAGYGFIVDLKNIGYRFLKGSDVMLRTEIQDPSADGRKDEYLGEIGLWRSLEKTHGLLKNGN